MPGIETWRLQKRANIRREPNPLDRATIVSIYPKDIKETKPTLFPGLWEIKGGSEATPSVTIIEPSSWFKEIDLDQPAIEVGVGSIVLADSIIRDYCNGLLECDMGNRMPGLFFVPGEKKLIEIKKDHPQLFITAKEKQDSWFQALVRMADTLWSRSSGNPMSICEDMRIAARQLNKTDKPWLDDMESPNIAQCPACGTMRNTNFPMCANCKTIIDPEKFKKMGLQVAS